MRRGRLILVLVVAVVAVTSAAWMIPFWGQARETRPVAELVSADAPHLDGPWKTEYARADAVLPPTGLAESGNRSWKRPDGAELGVTVRRFSSANWSQWTMSRENPTADPEGFDRIIEVPSRRAPGSAEEVHHWCGQIDGNPGACDNWWVWSRYGQYLVLVSAVDVPSANTEIPPWLHEMVDRVGGTLTSRAPRE